MAGVTMVRARNELGQYVADDPSTPDVNEAWVVVNDTSAGGGV